MKSGTKDMREEKVSEITTENFSLTFDKAIGQAWEMLQNRLKFIKCGHHSKAIRMVKKKKKKKSEISHANRPNLEW